MNMTVSVIPLFGCVGFVHDTVEYAYLRKGKYRLKYLATHRGKKKEPKLRECIAPSHPS